MTCSTRLRARIRISPRQRFVVKFFRRSVDNDDDDGFSYYKTTPGQLQQSYTVAVADHEEEIFSSNLYSTSSKLVTNRVPAREIILCTHTRAHKPPSSAARPRL